jgi:hypothetical protein
MRLKLVRALYAQEKQSLLNLARCASVAGALSVAGPVLADSDRPDLVNGTGDDPTKPLGKIELLDRYTEAPGPGVEEGTTKRVETNTPFARIDVPFRLTPQWELNFRTEIPVVWTNGVTPENPTGATVSGFGNVLTQAWIVHDFDQRWAVALGGQLIAPSSTNGVATDAWEQVTGFVVRAMLPEISPGSYFAPQVRYGIDFEGNDDGRMLRQLRIAPTLNINLPDNLFFTLYPSPDVRLNYGAPVHNQTGRLFLPLNFLVGWKPPRGRGPSTETWARVSRSKTCTIAVAPATARRMPGRPLKVLIEKITASVAAPSANSVQFILPPAISTAIDQMSRNGPAFSTLTPNSLGVWLTRTASAIPFM